MIMKIEAEDIVSCGALALIWRVFQAFEAPEYSEEGVRAFCDFIAPDAVRKRMEKGELLFWGRFHGNEPIGIIATRPPCHISLLFVDRAYHRRGIARSLFETAIDFYRAAGNCREMTVNASPYAQQAYRRVGFVPTGAEQTVNGIRFTPMRHVFR